MSERLKELLEKINQDGVKLAEDKSKKIESLAKKDAEKIINEARTKARILIEEAESGIRKMQEASVSALKHASRDILLSLKEEIRATLKKIIAVEAVQAVSGENLAIIIRELIEKFVEKGGAISEVKLLLKKDDFEKLEDVCIGKLKTKLKSGIDFRPSRNINSGFSVSFDSGKSFFDFSDEALIEALFAYLNPELAKLLKS